MNEEMKLLYDAACKRLLESMNRFMQQQASYMAQNPDHYEGTTPDDFIVWYCESGGE